MPNPEITVSITEYTVSLLPEDHPDYELYAVTVAYRGHDRYAVVKGKRCLDAAGDWDWEHIPSERTADWLTRHRFELPDAMRLAHQVAPTVCVNGSSAAQMAAELSAPGGAR